MSNSCMPHLIEGMESRAEANSNEVCETAWEVIRLSSQGTPGLDWLKQRQGEVAFVGNNCFALACTSPVLDKPNLDLCFSLRNSLVDSYSYAVDMESPQHKSTRAQECNGYDLWTLLCGLAPCFGASSLPLWFGSGDYWFCLWNCVWLLFYSTCILLAGSC